MNTQHSNAKLNDKFQYYELDAQTLERNRDIGLNSARL